MNNEEYQRAYKHAAQSIFGYLAGAGCGNRNMLASLWALAFETDMARSITHDSPSKVAKDLGITRAYMSYLRKQVRDSIEKGFDQLQP